MAEANPGSGSKSDLVRTLVREGRIEAALGAVQHGTATEQQLSEELHIYQAELLLQKLNGL